MLRNNTRTYGENRSRVRTLRRGRSASEDVLWDQLRKEKLGFKFRNQHPVGPYVLDFYCAEAKLCVEVDGEQHALRVEADARRDAYLAEFGIETIRVPSLDLFEYTGLVASGWLDEIRSRCEKRAGREAFPDASR